jgi:hypothetical protein
MAVSPHLIERGGGIDVPEYAHRVRPAMATIAFQKFSVEHADAASP